MIDLRIAWKLSNAANGARYERTGDLARAGARDKWRRWKKAVENHRDFTNGATFVPFSVEIGGAMSTEALDFWTMCVEWAGNARSVDRWHWSAASFNDFWTQAMGEDFGGGWGVRAMAATRRHGRGPVGPHSDAESGEQRHGYSHIGGECGHDIVTGPARLHAAAELSNG